MRSNIFLIDSRVKGYQTLIDRLATPSEVFIIEAESDGVAQIAATLQGRTDLDALHIISHGSEGALYLGASVLDSGNLASYSAQLASIGSALAPTGDVLLYGCNVAQGDAGVKFINAFAQATGADVAASSNSTGAKLLGGDTVLERVSGHVETSSLALEGLTGLLAVNPALQVLVNVAVSQAQVTEGSDLVYTFTRTGDLSAALTVNFGVGGTATANDYTSSLALSGSGSPTVQWTRLVGGRGDDYGNSVATSADGSVYVAGYTFSGSIDDQTSNGYVGGFVTKYTADGTKAWTRVTGGAGDPYAYSVATGADGSVYIAGRTNGSIDDQNINGGYVDGFVIKFNADGTKAWTRLTGGDGQDFGLSVSTGSDGSVYVGGYTYQGSIDDQTSNGDVDGFVSKYTADGTKAWTRMVGGAGFDLGQSVATGTDGSVYIAGYTYGSIDGQANNGGCDVFVTKYTADGAKVWTRLVGGEGVEASDSGSLVATSADGSVYIAGQTNSSSIDGQANNGGWDGFLTKFRADGTKAWTRLTGGVGNEAYGSVATGPDGSVYVAGNTDRSIEGQISDGGVDGYVTKYTADGTKVWTRLTGGSGNDVGMSVASDANGSVYIAGRTNGSIDGQTNHGNLDSFVTKFSDSAQAQVTFAAGSNTAKLTFRATADQLIEAPETLRVMVLAGNGYTLGSNGVATGAIVPYNTSAAENSKTVTTLALTDALLGTAPKYALNGTDDWLFKISSKGVLTFAAVKDFEQPVDANKDGVYEVSVTLTNSKTGYKVVRDLTVTVEFVPINGTAAADTLKGTAGYDTLDGKAGDDKLTGGAGLDTFLVSSGRDAVLDFNALTKGATGAEILQVSAGATADATLTAAWTATADSFNLGTANILTSGMAVDLSAVSQGQGWKVTNAGATATITGSRFNDVLTGGSDADLLNGGAGNDVLSGGKGADILTGGTGADTFRLSGDNKTDHITDFLSGTDRIELDNALFKALLAEGQLAANQFAQGTAATTAAQRIVYDSNSGNLWYDLDGSAKGKAVLIAVLDNHVPVVNTDFWVI